MGKRGKNNKVLAVIVLLAILAVAFFAMGGIGLLPFGWINPGFEGAKVYFYGAQFNGFGDWEGANMLHKYEDAESQLVYHESWGYWDKVYWGAYNQPSNPVIIWDWSDGIARDDRLQLRVEVQSQIPLEDVERQGDPLHFNDTNPTSGKLIQWWSLEEERISETETSYKLVKRDLLLVPGEFRIDLSIPSGQEPTKHKSGWQEGDWSAVQLWFMVFWHDWLNAYRPYIEDDPEPPELPSEAYNRQVLFEDRGGMAISGWIQGYEANIYTGQGPRYDDVAWEKHHDSEPAQTFTEEQLTALANLNAKTQLTPSLEGRFIDLFTDPSNVFSYPLPNLSGEQIEAYASANAPDPTMTAAQYFTLTINTLGTYVKSRGFLAGWNVYYPTVYYRLRFIFGVYGEHVYLWTEKTAEEHQYPEWEDRKVTRTVTLGPLSGFYAWWNNAMDWLSNPFNQLWVLLIIIVVVVIVISVASPGVWAVLARSKSKGG